MPENDDNDAKRAGRALNALAKPEPPMRRLVMRRRQSMSVSTALFYLQSKPDVDQEYRDIFEAIVDAIVRHVGCGSMEIADVEQSKPITTED